MTEQEQAIATLKEMRILIDTAIKSIDPWHPATEKPKDDERVIVRDYNGATYMLTPNRGIFPSKVCKWMYIPD